MEDGRKGIPYAPYLMLMIERLTGYRFEKGLHTIYKIEKTQGAGASRAVKCSHQLRICLSRPNLGLAGKRRWRSLGDGLRPSSPHALMQRGPHIRTSWTTVKPTRRLESVQGCHIFLQFSHHQGLMTSLVFLRQIQRIRRRRSRSSQSLILTCV